MGKLENQGGQIFKKFFSELSPKIFAHPGLKPCRRPWTSQCRDISHCVSSRWI